MSAIERFPRGPFEPSEALGEVPPQESLQLLAHEHEKTPATRAQRARSRSRISSEWRPRATAS